MKCSRCGTENRAEVRFCRHCGQRLVLEQPQTPPAVLAVDPVAQPNTVCGVCGAAVKANARFCPRCGNELRVSPPPPSLQQPVIPIPAQIPEPTSITGQMPSSGTPVPPTYQAPPQKPSYSQPKESPPPSVKDQYTKQEIALKEQKQIKKKVQKTSSKWIWGAVIGIIILVIILIVLSTIFIPKALKGTGLLPTKTETAIVVEQPSPTLTSTPFSSPTTEPTPTLEVTIEPSPVTVIPAASAILTTTPETITVDSQVVVTISLTNDSEEPIMPLRCDLVGAFAPVLKPAEGMTYTLILTDIDTPLVPGTTTMFIYRFDVLQAGTTTIGADILIEVNTPDHRQVVITPMVTLKVE